METTRPSLLLRIRNPDDAVSWRTFSEIYRPILLRYALARGLARSDAEDVAQHVLLAVHQNIASFEYDPRKGRFKGWLRTIVNNHIRNLARKQAAGERARNGAARCNEPAEPSTPESEFDRIWMQEHLWHCLRRLRTEVAARDLDVFNQLVFANASAESVCEQFGISVGNARTIKWRIMRRLAELMRELAGDEESPGEEVV